MKLGEGPNNKGLQKMVPNYPSFENQFMIGLEYSQKAKGPVLSLWDHSF